MLKLKKKKLDSLKKESHTIIKKASKFVNAVNEFYFELEENLPSKHMKKQELWFDDNFKNHTIYLPALTRNLKSKFIMSIFPELRFMLSFISWGTIVRDSNYCQSLTYCRQNLSLFRTSQELNDTHRKDLSFNHISTVIAPWLLLIFYIYTIN